MTLEDILEAVVEVTGVTVEDMTIYSHKREFNEARTLYYEVARSQGYIYSEIGESVNRKHSGVLLAMKTNHHTPEFKASLDKVLVYLGISEEEEEEITPLWNESFRVVDISSKHFGPCFMGLDNGEIVTSGCRPEVINAMLDHERI